MLIEFHLRGGLCILKSEVASSQPTIVCKLAVTNTIRVREKFCTKMLVNVSFSYVNIHQIVFAATSLQIIDALWRWLVNKTSWKFKATFCNRENYFDGVCKEKISNDWFQFLVFFSNCCRIAQTSMLLSKTLFNRKRLGLEASFSRSALHRTREMRHIRNALELLIFACNWDRKIWI